MIQPVNSIVFVSGGGKVDVPFDKVDPDRHLVAASKSSLIVSVLPEVDGETELTFGYSKELDTSWPAGFVGEIDTPHGELIVETVDEKILVRQAVDSLTTKLRIWFNNPVWPSRVLIGID